MYLLQAFFLQLQSLDRQLKLANHIREVLSNVGISKQFVFGWTLTLHATVVSKDFPYIFKASSENINVLQVEQCNHDCKSGAEGFCLTDLGGMRRWYPQSLDLSNG